MGHHYIPQYYLEGFSSLDTNMVWVYEKNGPLKFQTTVINTANEKNYYGQEVENYLSKEIEGPANSVINKIRNRVNISNEDKMTLAIYMVVMLKRVPQSKLRMREMAPDVANKLQAKWDDETNQLIRTNQDQEEYYRKRLNELKENQEKFLKDPPKDFWLALIPPERTPSVIKILQKMTWLFLTNDTEPVFLTCDNPVFYFSELGIGRSESEVTFPIASNITLWASWRKDLTEGYVQAKSQACKEINRRTAFNATRFIYYKRDDDWVHNFINKKHLKLNFLR